MPDPSWSERWVEANGWMALAFYFQDRREPLRARDCYRRVRRLAGRAGLRYTMAAAILDDATACEEADDVPAALASYEDAIGRYRTLGGSRAEGFAHTLRSGLLARQRDLAGAEAELARGRDLLTYSGDRALLEVANLQAGQLHLGFARVAALAGDLEEAARRRRKASRLIRAATGDPGRRPHASKRSRASVAIAPARRSVAVRMVLRPMERELATLDPRSLTAMQVAADGSAFKLGSRPAVSFPRGSVVRRALALFAEARLENPGRALSVNEVLRRCWPGERPLGDSGPVRVRGVVRRLRRAGLEGVLRTTGEGYLFDPSVNLTRSTGRLAD